MLKRIGVLALQGDFREHIAAYTRLGVEAIEVKTLKALESIDALVIPGGESTTIGKLANIFGLFEPIKAAIKDGLPVFGTCAGLIMLADRIEDGIEPAANAIWTSAIALSPLAVAATSSPSTSGPPSRSHCRTR